MCLLPIPDKIVRFGTAVTGILKSHTDEDLVEEMKDVVNSDGPNKEDPKHLLRF